MTKTIHVVAFAAIAVACVLFATRRPDPPPARETANRSSGEAKGSEPGPDAHSSEPVMRGANRESPAGRNAAEAAPTIGLPALSTSDFPPEYTGIRDKNLVGIYSTMKRSIKFEEERLKRANESDYRHGIDLNYLEATAYVALIQNQNLYFFGYTTPPKRPPNTRDVEYHLTGAGGMCVILELTRQEFPDLFAAKDKKESASARADVGR